MAGDDPSILAHAAQALAYFGEDIGAMMALVDRALALNPNFARGWHISGALRSWAGQPDIAIKHLEAALRLSPRARVGTTFAVAKHIYSAVASMRQCRSCSLRSKTIPPSRSHIASSPPAMPMWVGSTTHERSWSDCGPLPLS